MAQYISETAAPGTIAPTLRDLIEEHLAVRLDKDVITALLPEYDLKLADLAVALEQLRASLPAILDRWRAGVHGESLIPT